MSNGAWHHRVIFSQLNSAIDLYNRNNENTFCEIKEILQNNWLVKHEMKMGTRWYLELLVTILLQVKICRI